MNILKNFAQKETSQARKIELRCLILTTIALLFGLFFVYQVKTQRPITFSELPEKMRSEEVRDNGKIVEKIPEIVSLKQIKNKGELLPYLSRFENDADRNFAAEKLIENINTDRGKIKNVGFLSSISISKKQIDLENERLSKNKEQLEYFNKSFADAQKKADERNKLELDSVNQIREKVKNFIEYFWKSEDKELKISVLGTLGSLKSSFVVRTPDEFLNTLLIWSFVFFGSFFGLHIFWRIRRFDGDGLILPPIFFLCGIGFLMMVSMRDPLRDSLLFVDFAFGVLTGCIAIAVITSIDFQNVSLWIQKQFPKFADYLINYAPIVLAILLSLALILVGKTPGASDAKVNLDIGVATIQPSEVIKILFAVFLALYFAERWEYFRYLEKKWGQFSFPRIKDAWLVAVFIAALLALFFLQKDLGPALLMAGLFLVLFAVVRKRVGLSILGFLTIIAAYIGNYYWRKSATAADRLDIWRNPWDTHVTGGDQIVHSLWSFATGGLTGTGLGLGDPYFAPAHHTDLILASAGEELGFIGIFFIFAVYGLLFYRCYVIAKQAFSPFAYFLALGLGIINALQLFFISAGILGLIPLSGVVTPFLSDGMSSMICNFVSFGILLAISAEKGSSPKNLADPTKYVAYGFVGLACIILLKAFTVQVWNSDEILIRGVLAPVRDEVIAGNMTTGIRRYAYNPRINLAKRELPFGTIYDRSGIPLASSDWDELSKFTEEYEKLGVALQDVCKKGVRCYPFGNKMFHLIGDALTERNWSAGNTNFIEKDYQDILRGYDDHAEIVNIKVRQMRPEKKEIGETVTDPETKNIILKEEEIDLPIEKRDYKELLPLIRNRYNPINISANLLKFKNRSIKTSIDARLQIELTSILKTEIEARKLKKGAIVVLEPGTGDLLASVNYPIPADETADDDNGKDLDQKVERESLLDRARSGVYPPGSTFKIITEMAAMRKDPNANAPNKSFSCIHLSGNRVGNIVRGREIRDFEGDDPHDTITFQMALTVSCNAYFAQLGTDFVGADELFKTANIFDISMAAITGKKDAGNYELTAELNEYLPQSSFGQGEVLASPFQIARVSATVANGGLMQVGRWVTDENNRRKDEAVQVISAGQASIIAEAMREVVIHPRGTGKSLAGNPIEIAGKTGTAENGKIENKKYVSLTSHSWFTGFAPYNHPNQRIAFAVIIENGGTGGKIAAQIAGKVVESAKNAGLIQ